MICHAFKSVENGRSRHLREISRTGNNMTKTTLFAVGAENHMFALVECIVILRVGWVRGWVLRVCYVYFDVHCGSLLTNDVSFKKRRGPLIKGNASSATLRAEDFLPSNVKVRHLSIFFFNFKAMIYLNQFVIS